MPVRSFTMPVRSFLVSLPMAWGFPRLIFYVSLDLAMSPGGDDEGDDRGSGRHSVRRRVEPSHSRHVPVPAGGAVGVDVATARLAPVALLARVRGDRGDALAGGEVR